MDILLILIGGLLALTVCTAFEYYKQVQKVRREYEKAREIIDDIVVSFNRELKQKAEQTERMAYKVEALSSKSERAINKAEETHKGLRSLEEKVSKVLEYKEEMSKRLVEVDEKVSALSAAFERLNLKVSEVEEQTRRFSMVPEAKIEAVIPIKREKALAPLTETELSVLEMLASEGPKTAPEIKERIKLSREHTARLMKKLYEGGYLERDTSKIPFKYNVKKEMENILKKKELAQ
ncbi:MAG: MarR family transcriptional regulator [Candidatus Bathyarchaeota archaeon]|nr:MarR family transcriptional regulator [Candidatus Bathyarchaeota archaeon]